MKLTTHSDSETKKFGKKLATTLRGGDIVCLYGELGAGKTTLVKGIAAGLGVKEEITSPTFTLMGVYPILDLRFKISDLKSQIANLVHIDTYRLKNEQELIGIGALDYLGQPDTITIIEWPEKIMRLIGASAGEAEKTLKVYLEHQKEKIRSIRIGGWC